MQGTRYTIRVLAFAVVLAAAGALALGAAALLGRGTSATGPTAPELPPRNAVDVAQRESSNWAGYVATGKTFSSVSGGWRQPSVDCSVSSPAYSAFWVGLGGYFSRHLEQIGTSADCSPSGRPVYWVWYELVPAPEVPVPMTVEPGDRLWARVGVSGQTVTLYITNLTRHTTFSKRVHMASPSVTSAEWIAEAPSHCAPSDERCRVLPLAAFDSVTFTGATAAVGGRFGPIDSGLGSLTALTLDANPGFGRLQGAAAEADASVGGLSSSGSSFTVNSKQPTVQVSS